MQGYETRSSTCNKQMVEQQAKGTIIGIGSTEKMCVSHGKALDKTNIRMIIKHQQSLEEMRLKVLDISFQHTQS